MNEMEKRLPGFGDAREAFFCEECLKKRNLESIMINTDNSCT